MRQLDGRNFFTENIEKEAKVVKVSRNASYTYFRGPKKKGGGGLGAKRGLNEGANLFHERAGVSLISNRKLNQINWARR